MSLTPNGKSALRKRLITVVSVCALLSQIVFIGPVRKANAKAKSPVPVTSSPAEPFVVHDSGFQVASLLKPSGLAGTLLGFVASATARMDVEQ